VGRGREGGNVHGRGGNGYHDVYKMGGSSGFELVWEGGASFLG